MHHATLIAAATLALASPWAAGQTVYRCGNSYSQQPCAGGTAIETPTAPSATGAGSVAAADAKRADALEKARLAQEKNAPRAIVIGPQSPASAAAGEPRKDASKPKTGKLEQFTSVSPGKPGEAGTKKKPKKKKTA